MSVLSPSVVANGLAIVVAGMLSYHRLVRGRVPPATATSLQVFALTGAAIGGYGLLTFFRLAEALLTGREAALPDAGLTLIGVIAGGAGAAAGFLRWRGLPVGATLDLGVVPVPLGLAIVRLGCHVNGCCWGQETEGALGWWLPDRAGSVELRFPTQLLSAAAHVAIYLLLALMERRTARREERSGGGGMLVWTFLGLHCLVRLVLEELRATSAAVIGPLTIPQVACAIGVATAAFAVAGRRRGSPA